MAKKTTGYTIGMAADFLQVHPQTLRGYEREGLVRPSRTGGNMRLYRDEDLQRLQTILSLTRDQGVNLAGVAVILELRDQLERMRREAEEREACFSWARRSRKARPRAL